MRSVSQNESGFVGSGELGNLGSIVGVSTCSIFLNGEEISLFLTKTFSCSTLNFAGAERSRAHFSHEFFFSNGPRLDLRIFNLESVHLSERLDIEHDTCNQTLILGYESLAEGRTLTVSSSN